MGTKDLHLQELDFQRYCLFSMVCREVSLLFTFCVYDCVRTVINTYVSVEEKSEERELMYHLLITFADVLARRKQLHSKVPGRGVPCPSQSRTIKGGSKVTSISLSRKAPASLLPSSAPTAPSQKTSDTAQPSQAVGNSRHCGEYNSNLSRSNAGNVANCIDIVAT